MGGDETSLLFLRRYRSRIYTHYRIVTRYTHTHKRTRERERGRGTSPGIRALGCCRERGARTPWSSLFSLSLSLSLSLSPLSFPFVERDREKEQERERPQSLSSCELLFTPRAGASEWRPRPRGNKERLERVPQESRSPALVYLYPCLVAASFGLFLLSERALCYNRLRYLSILWWCSRFVVIAAL